MVDGACNHSPIDRQQNLASTLEDIHHGWGDKLILPSRQQQDRALDLLNGSLVVPFRWEETVKDMHLNFESGAAVNHNLGS